MARACARAKVEKRMLQETGFKKSLKRMEFEQEIFKCCMHARKKTRRKKKTAGTNYARNDLPSLPSSCCCSANFKTCWCVRLTKERTMNTAKCKNEVFIKRELVF